MMFLTPRVPHLLVTSSFCDAKAAETRSVMLPAVVESDVEPSELERLALRSNRLLSKLVDTGDKKNEYANRSSMRAIAMSVWTSPSHFAVVAFCSDASALRRTLRASLAREQRDVKRISPTCVPALTTTRALGC